LLTLPPVRRLAAEGVGTGVLVVAVVGSGIMAARLTSDGGLDLVINAVATVATLGVLIVTLGPVSGAHVNPAVSLVALAQRKLSGSEATAYVLIQILGAAVGVAVANLMFGLPAWDPSTHGRDAFGMLIGEVMATAGLLFAIGSLTRTGRARLGAVVVPAWIGAAYFFTASTSFANPAVTIGRSLTDSFTGIAPASVAPFVAAQLAGAALGAAATELLHPRHGVRVVDLPEAVHEQP
jgi:glycerol uptake facilitator-like aquaporin